MGDEPILLNKNHFNESNTLITSHTANAESTAHNYSQMVTLDPFAVHIYRHTHANAHACKATVAREQE